MPCLGKLYLHYLGKIRKHLLVRYMPKWIDRDSPCRFNTKTAAYCTSTLAKQFQNSLSKRPKRIENAYVLAQVALAPSGSISFSLCQRRQMWKLHCISQLMQSIIKMDTASTMTAISVRLLDCSRHLSKPALLKYYHSFTSLRQPLAHRPGIPVRPWQRLDARRDLGTLTTAMCLLLITTSSTPVVRLDCRPFRGVEVQHGQPTCTGWTRRLSAFNVI